MKESADPMLLSLLQKIANPLTELNLIITLKGVFAPSQQWKQSDEANPNIFTYSLQVFGNHFSNGKIEPRKLTEKEIKEQQQAKNKKASKKQAKQQQKPQQIDPDAQRKRLEWQALSEQERFYRTQQDPFKAFSLKWSDNKKEQHLTGDSLHNFEDAVSNGSLDIILMRKPEGGQQEIAKLKKAKAKGLNLGQLYSAKYKGSMNLKELNIPGSVSITQRIPISFSGDLPAECIRIDCDKCYALVEIALNQPINPQVKEEKPSSRQLLGEPAKAQVSGNLLGKLKEEIRKGMRAISQEYSLYFVKQKDHTSDDRKMNTSNNTNFLSVSTLRINEISKRKEQFLSEFVSSGKYAILRERISKTVKAIVVDKCRKEKTGGAISKEQFHRTLSELNVFLREMIQKILDQSVSTQATALHEDIVLGHQYTRSGRRQALTGVAQSCQEREERLALQYEIINKIQQAEAKFLNLTILQNYSIYSLETYAKFCLRHGYYDKAYALYKRVAIQSSQFRHQLIICLFQAHRNRQLEAINQALKLTEGQGSAQQKAIVHELLSFLHERIGEQKRAQKHLALAEKYYQIKTNPNLKVNPPKNPYIEPIPRIPKPGKYVSQLSQHESQQLRFSLVTYFIDHSFYGLVKDYLPKLVDSDRKKQIQALVLVSLKQFDRAVSLVETLLEKDPKNMDLLLLKAQICFKSQKLFECEEVFLYLLRLKPYPVQCYAIYLRLALTYLQRMSWEDSKATFNKAVELKPNSAAGWLGLGIANLRLSLLKESEEAFNLSSIYNPLSKEPQQYLQQISVQVNKEQQAAYPYLQKAES